MKMSIKFEYATNVEPYEHVVKKNVASELLEALQDLEARACIYVNTSKAKAAIAKALVESQ